MIYDKIKVGQRLRDIRQSLGLTQEQVGNKIDRAPRFIMRMENGKVGMSIETMLALCTVYAITPDALLIGADQQTLGNNAAYIAQAIDACPPEKQESAVKLLELFLKAIE